MGRNDRELKDIFQIQSDVAERIATALAVELSPSDRERIEQKPTANLEAYDYYLRGKNYISRGYNESNFRAAIQLYEQALRLDPTFAIAYAALSTAHSQMWWFYYDRSEERLGKAKAAVDKALQLSPDRPEVQTALGYFYYFGFLDYDRALKHFEIARKGQPNDSELLAGIAFVRRRQGKLDESILHLKDALSLDPQSADIAYNLGVNYSLTRKSREAEHYLDRANSLSPDWEDPYAAKAHLYLRLEANPQKARSVLNSADAAGLAENPRISRLSAVVDLCDGRYDEALKRLISDAWDVDRHQSEHVPKTLLLGQCYGLTGRRQSETEQ